LVGVERPLLFFVWKVSGIHVFGMVPAAGVIGRTAAVTTGGVPVTFGGM
jgi:hypothetical protein